MISDLLHRLVSFCGLHIGAGQVPGLVRTLCQVMLGFCKCNTQLTQYIIWQITQSNKDFSTHNIMPKICNNSACNKLSNI